MQSSVNAEPQEKQNENPEVTTKGGEAAEETPQYTVTLVKKISYLSNEYEQEKVIDQQQQETPSNITSIPDLETAQVIDQSDFLSLIENDYKTFDFQDDIYVEHRTNEFQEFVTEKAGKTGHVYTGQQKYFKDGFTKLHGKGFMKFAGELGFESSYVGWWKNGKKDGIGIRRYIDGMCYIGQYRKGKWHGVGKFIYPDGEYYQGEFVDNEWEGQGMYQDNDGIKYFGKFQNGKRHGLITVLNVDNKVQQGIWEDGEFVKWC